MFVKLMNCAGTSFWLYPMPGMSIYPVTDGYRESCGPGIYAPPSTALSYIDIIGYDNPIFLPHEAKEVAKWFNEAMLVTVTVKEEDK